MSRMTQLNSPLLLGFDDIERLLDRLAKSPGESYPPYNIERVAVNQSAATNVSALSPGRSGGEILRITLAVAGFTREQLDIAVEDSQLTIRGRQDDDKSRNFVHRGIAARQFQRTFVLADGIQVRSASLDNGLLSIDLVRPEPERVVRKIEIANGG
jgi:HSP20 family molecular chaperone IbpA